LPVTDAMKVISTESPPPVGPEFLEVVEGQRIGITMDQGIDRMFDRMPLAEVNFLGIVMAIQQKTGGNLAEALNNLSKVLRDRKKMKAKIRAVSQEAKASAAIIGSLPFLIMGAMMVLNPAYLNPLFETKLFLDLFVLWKVVLLGILTRIQVIKNAEKLVETVSGRQMFVPVAQVVLSELPGHVTLILQHPRKGGIFGLNSFLGAGEPNRAQTGPHGVLAQDEGGAR
jgi:hypothetical protein